VTVKGILAKMLRLANLLEVCWNSSRLVGQ